MCVWSHDDVFGVDLIMDTKMYGPENGEYAALLRLLNAARTFLRQLDECGFIPPCLYPKEARRELDQRIEEAMRYT